MLMIFINCVLFLRIHKTSPLYASCLYFVPWNVHIIDIECPQGICLPIFVMDDFSKLFLHPYSFNKRFKICMNNRWCLIIFRLLIKLQCLNFFSRHYNNTKISIFTYFFMRFKFVFCSKRMKTIQTVRIPNILWRYSS